MSVFVYLYSAHLAQRSFCNFIHAVLDEAVDAQIRRTALFTTLRTAPLSTHRVELQKALRVERMQANARR